jgi:toxin ParE1/3/4
MKVRFTPGARAQFLGALDFVRADDPGAALDLRDRAATSLSRLTRFRESGRVTPEFPDLAFREVVLAPYRFFYRAKGDIVWIVAVWHSAQVPLEPAKEERG